MRTSRDTSLGEGGPPSSTGQIAELTRTEATVRPSPVLRERTPDTAEAGSGPSTSRRGLQPGTTSSAASSALRSRIEPLEVDWRASTSDTSIETPGPEACPARLPTYLSNAERASASVRASMSTSTRAPTRTRARLTSRSEAAGKATMAASTGTSLTDTSSTRPHLMSAGSRRTHTLFVRAHPAASAIAIETAAARS